MMDAPERIWVECECALTMAEILDMRRLNVTPILDTEYIEYIRADLVPQWQPIETAPKDGGKDTLVGWHSDHYGKFVWAKAGLVRGIWYKSGGTGTALYPTHWMPTPTQTTVPKQEP